jgi:hypothetical protein
MDKSKIAKAEKLLDELTEMLTARNLSAETLTALIKLRDAAGPALRKAATRETLDGGNVISDSTVAAERSRLGISSLSNPGGTVWSALTPAEIEATFKQRIANAMKRFSDPSARATAGTEEWLQCMKELLQAKPSNVPMQAIIQAIPAETMAEIGKAAGESTLDLIKASHATGGSPLHESRTGALPEGSRRLTDREFGRYKN